MSPDPTAIVALAPLLCAILRRRSSQYESVGHSAVPMHASVKIRIVAM
jgi:hypothetical protein